MALSLPLKIALVRARKGNACALGQGVGPPLGLMAIASYARNVFEDAIKIGIHDTYFFSLDETAAWLRRFAPHIVGISGVTAESSGIREIAKLCRSLFGNAVKIWVGGPHATAYPELCLKEYGADAVVPGEGELPFSELIEEELGRRESGTARGVVRSAPDNSFNSTQPPPPLDLKELPLPAYDLVDFRLYSLVPNTLATIVLPPHRYAPLFISRGCPFKCTFCHNIFGKKFRTPSVNDVIAHIRYLRDYYQISNFHIYDDILNANRKFFNQFLEEVVRQKLNVKLYFVNGLRFDALQKDEILAMKEAKVVYVAAAIETASPRLQKKIRKHIVIDKALENIAYTDRAGIFTNGFMMLGFPTETLEEMEQTIRCAVESRLHYVYFSILNPFKGTEIAREVQGLTDVKLFADGYSLAGVNFAGIPPKEMRSIIRHAYKRFWTPKRLLAFVARHPDIEGFLEGLANRPFRQLLFQRVMSVLGMGEVLQSQAKWTAPELIHPFVSSAVRKIGFAAYATAKTTYELFISSSGPL